MYVEVIIEPGGSEVQFCAVSDLRSVLHSEAAETRIVIFFTNSSETRAALRPGGFVRRSHSARLHDHSESSWPAAIGAFCSIRQEGWIVSCPERAESAPPFGLAVYRRPGFRGGFHRTSVHRPDQARPVATVGAYFARGVAMNTGTLSIVL